MCIMCNRYTHDTSSNICLSYMCNRYTHDTSSNICLSCVIGIHMILALHSVYRYLYRYDGMVKKRKKKKKKKKDMMVCNG